MAASKENTAVEPRNLGRLASAGVQFPVSCRFHLGAQSLPAEVINYHFGGACLRIDEKHSKELKFSERKLPRLDFYIGNKCIKSDLNYRLCWEDFRDSYTCGIEFLDSIGTWVEREVRIPTHAKLKPALWGQDPLDPNRKIYFQVVDVSHSGMQVATSMTNKHLFPGMSLQNYQLAIPGAEPLAVDLMIENTRVSQTGEATFHLGVSIDGKNDAYREALRHYLSCLAPALETSDRSAQLKEAGFVGKQIKSALSFRLAATETEYNEVLKLRFKGYSAAGKVRPGATWRDQGDGAQNEGSILCAYLGGQLIASLELRFGDSRQGLRFFKSAGESVTSKIDFAKTVEINKLVVHPDMQGSDIVLGMIQRVHSMVLTRGGLDIVMAATPKLVPLYERVGAEKLGHTIPHAFIPGEVLHLLAIRRESYMGEARLNPYAWNLVCGAVHEAMQNWGMVAPVKRNFFRRTLGLATALYLKIKKKQNEKSLEQPRSSVSRQHETGQRGSNSKFISPSLTEQQMLASVIWPYIVEAEMMVGAAKINAMLDRVGMPREYLMKQSNWVSVEFLDKLLDEFGVEASVADLSRRAGIRSMKRDIVGMNYYALKHVLSPETAFRAFEKLSSRFNRTRTYRLIELVSGRGRVAVGLAAGHKLPKHAESCLNWQANIESSIQLIVGMGTQVKKTACCYHGDPECVYEVSWQPQQKLLINLAKWAAAPLMGLLTARFLGVPGGLAVGFAMAWSYAYWKNNGERRERQNVTEEFEQFQSETNEKYSELQRAKEQLDLRYRESVLLEEISKEIQKSSELSKTLKVSLDAVCKVLNFSRAFLMLADAEKKFLHTAAVTGVDQSVREIWDFKIDVATRRENPLVLSSVYLSGSPVMIDDVSTHKFQLNEASQRLVERLGAKGFVMVSIPSSTDRNWGVIVADKAARSEALGRRDVVLLQRVAQYLGLALDKQAKLDQETQLKNLFKKYVPSAILDEAVGSKGPALGGQLKDIACMFLDIRGFTHMTNELPPHATIDLLNRVFTVVQDIVTAHRGVIDKFLGDGVLVTWGAAGNGRVDASNALAAAREILKRLEGLNADLQSVNLPRIDLGMGLHAGQAVVGNIGSQDRMEFTSIGTTVNVASRLESLCKELKSRLVISNELLIRVPAELRADFEVLEGVRIRGMDQATSVGRLIEEGVLKIVKKVA